MNKEGSPPAPDRPGLRPRGLGVSITSPGKFAEGGLRDVVRIAGWIEELGFQTITCGEHVVTSEEIAARGNDRWYREQVIYSDPLVTLAAVAAVTEKVRLCTSIYIVPLRPAAAVAKMVATLDAISGGRFTFGVGAGWLAREFDALGVPMKGRFARMEESIRACKVLWTEAPASFHSETVNFDEVWCLPQPVQPGGPPILFAGDPGGTPDSRADPGQHEPASPDRRAYPGKHSRSTARRIAELGDGWIVRTGAVKDRDEETEKIQADLATIRQAFVEAGRDPSTLMLQIGTLAKRDENGRVDLDHTFREVERYWDLGIQMVQMSLTQFVDKPAEVRPFLEEVSGALVAR